MSGVSWVVGIAIMALAYYVGSRKMNRTLDARDEEIVNRFPILKELQPGQTISVELTNGETISEAELVSARNGKISLASDKRMDKKTGELAYHELLNVKIAEIKAIHPNE